VDQSLKEQIERYLKTLIERPIGSLYTEQDNTRQQKLDELKKAFTGCTKCPLASQGRSQVVFGTGNPHAKLMFVGEGPGRDEDKHGEPFVGRAGKLLTKIIEAMNLSRDDVYISNTVKCRPPANRTPLPDESKTCINALLLHEIAIVQPLVICTLGATATRALLGNDIRISDVRGKFIQLDRFSVLPTYHPAYLLRNPSAKVHVWNDMKQIMDKFGPL